MDFTEIFTALETEIIDGADASGLANNVGLGLYDIANNATYPGFHSMPADHLACRLDVWESLPEDLQRIMSVAMDKLAFRTSMTFEVMNNEAAVALEEKGVNIADWSQEDRAAFRKAAQEQWQGWADEDARGQEAGRQPPGLHEEPRPGRRVTLPRAGPRPGPPLHLAGVLMVEHQPTGWMDRISLVISRICMAVVAIIVAVMFYEVVVRYVFEAPTLWANEMSLWMAGFVFLLSGLYAMQQRSHIRIYIIYDMFPRGVQRACDVISTVLIVLFVAAVLYGGFNEACDKLLRWETFGTAFDPPIPATIKPAVLIVLVLVALQAVSNLIYDWSSEKIMHVPVDDLDEIEALKKTLH